MGSTSGVALEISTLENKVLCVMMPALNEAATVADVIARVPMHIKGISRVVVLVIDDGSTDRTRAGSARILLVRGKRACYHANMHFRNWRRSLSGSQNAMAGCENWVNIVLPSEGRFSDGCPMRIVVPM